MNIRTPAEDEVQMPITSCALAAALGVVTGKWKPPILWYLRASPQRLGTLRRLIGPISEKVLVEQLRQLEADGIVVRTDFGEKPLRVEYALSEHGVALLPVLTHLSRWGQLRISRLQSVNLTADPQGESAT